MQHKNSDSLHSFPAIALAIAMAGAAAIVFCFNPMSTWWMPKCPFLMLTGLKCPSCGNTRALYHLLHGHPADALAFNPFLAISIPLFFVIALGYFLRPKWAQGRAMRILIIAYIALYLLWWVIRNIYSL